jgi:hypothetical protein
MTRLVIRNQKADMGVISQDDEHIDEGKGGAHMEGNFEEDAELSHEDPRDQTDSSEVNPWSQDLPDHLSASTGVSEHRIRVWDNTLPIKRSIRACVLPHRRKSPYALILTATVLKTF